METIQQFHELAVALPLEGLIAQRNNWRTDIHPVGQMIYNLFDEKIKTYE
jgi:hypothetical protein